MQEIFVIKKTNVSLLNSELVPHQYKLFSQFYIELFADYRTIKRNQLLLCYSDCKCIIVMFANNEQSHNSNPTSLIKYFDLKYFQLL